MTIVIFAYCGGTRKNFAMVNANIALVGDMTQKVAHSPKANFDLTLPEGYENSSDDSKTSTYKERSPAKVSDISRMLPNSSSSDVSLKPEVKQTSTDSKEVSTEMIYYPEK